MQTKLEELLLQREPLTSLQKDINCRVSAAYLTGLHEHTISICLYITEDQSMEGSAGLQ